MPDTRGGGTHTVVFFYEEGGTLENNTATPLLFSPGVLAYSQRDERSKAAQSNRDSPISAHPVNDNDLAKPFFS